MEGFADFLPGVCAVLGVVWLGALACWIAPKIKVKSGVADNINRTLTVSGD